MTPEFLYYTYQDSTADDNDIVRERSEVITSRANQKLSDLHLAEP